jgi:hypothetical protein
MAESFHQAAIDALRAGREPAQVALQVAEAADRALEFQTRALFDAQAALERSVWREAWLVEHVESGEVRERWKRMRSGREDSPDAGSEANDAQAGAGVAGAGSRETVGDGPHGAGAGGDGAPGAA